MILIILSCGWKYFYIIIDQAVPLGPNTYDMAKISPIAAYFLRAQFFSSPWQFFSSTGVVFSGHGQARVKFCPLWETWMTSLIFTSRFLRISLIIKFVSANWKWKFGLAVVNRLVEDNHTNFLVNREFFNSAKGSNILQFA